MLIRMVLNIRKTGLSAQIVNTIVNLEGVVIVLKNIIF